MAFGTLYMIPTPLGEEGFQAIPADVIDRVARLDFFVAEREKTARRFIKQCAPTKSQQLLHIEELNKRTSLEELPDLLKPLLDGNDLGMLSEAGCPGVADPGAVLVRAAHEKGIQVVPLTGPSSIILALMAGGMNGQSFCFHGYLPAKLPELQQRLKQLEQQAGRFRQTQLFIETPYRNQKLLENILNTLQTHTVLSIAADLTLPSAYIRTQTIGEWRSAELPDLHKRPAVFSIFAGPRVRL